MLDHSFCIAPMLDWTDRHERYFLRLFSKHTVLYTEMITCAAITHGHKESLLEINQMEHPVALQLGGSCVEELSQCAILAQQMGYDEINLNIGCPSDRVQSGRFGACLMADPVLVAKCVSAMISVTDLPVTIKCRIGIDKMDSDEALQRFVEIVANAGCLTFIVHARIAVLKGLSPKQNRDIPPLNYPRVYRLKQRFPELEIIINGGIKSLSIGKELLSHVDGIMVGREAYQNPYILTQVDANFFGASETLKSRTEILVEFLPYMKSELDRGTSLQHMTRHILGLYKGLPGGKSFRRHLSEFAHRKDAGISVMEDAIAMMPG